MLPGTYGKKVFISCPFDRKHDPLFRAMVFAVRTFVLAFLDANPW
jgi:hypothetical protein